MLILRYILESRSGEAFECNKHILFLLKGARYPVWLWHDPIPTSPLRKLQWSKTWVLKKCLSAIWSFSASCLSRGGGAPAILLKNTESKKHIPHYHIPFFSNTCFKIRNEHNYWSSADGKWNVRGRYYYCYFYYCYWSSRKCSAIKTLLSSHSLLQAIKGLLHTYISFQTESWIINFALDVPERKLF